MAETSILYQYSRLQKYCNKFSTSSSTGFHHSFDNTIGSPLYSGAGSGEFVAILLQSTVCEFSHCGFIPKKVMILMNIISQLNPESCEMAL